MVKKVTKIDPIRVARPPYGLIFGANEAYGSQEAFGSVPGPQGIKNEWGKGEIQKT